MRTLVIVAALIALGSLGPGKADGHANGGFPRTAKRAVNVGVSHATFARGHGVGGYVWAWGNDSADDLGLGPVSNACDCVARPTPVPGLRNIIQVSGGPGSVVVLGANGRVWTWGSNAAGQAGDGTVSRSGCKCDPHPTRVPTVGHIVAVASGGGGDLALRQDGTVWAWGLNNVGQLGIGMVSTTGCTCIPFPTKVSSLRNVLRISSSNLTAGAVTRSGQIWTWGADQWGQLGNGSVITAGCACQPTPVRVASIDHVVELATNGDWALALLSDGRVDSWGRAQFLGTKASPTASCYCVDHPVPVNHLDNVVAVSNNGNFNMALSANGTLETWGTDENSQLGTGRWPGSDPPEVPYPTRANALRRYHLIAVGADGYSGVALTKGHRVVEWGDNFWGELGRGFVSTFGPCSCEPKPQMVFRAGVTAIATGDRAVFAIKRG